jgi:hypothetical protein
MGAPHPGVSSSGCATNMIMKPALLWLTTSIAFLALMPLWAGDKESVTHYVQLVRGSNDANPPADGAKPIGPKLSKALSSVFQWKYYWEIELQEVAARPGHKTQVHLKHRRGVEIDLSTPGKRKVTALQDDKPITSVTQPTGETWTLIGGDRDPKSVWFIVVRRDKPSE